MSIRAKATWVRLSLALLLCSTGCAAYVEGMDEDAENETLESDVENAIEAEVQPLIGNRPFGMIAAEEFPDFGVDQMRAQLPLLQEHGVGLLLHWPSDQIDDPKRWQLVAEAHRLGVEVWPWLLLPEGTTATTGYFPGSTNYAEFIKRAEELMVAWERRGYAPTTFAVDMELRKDRLEPLREMLRNGASVDALVTYLRSFIDREQYRKATAAYKAFVDRAHSYVRPDLRLRRKPWRVQLTTLPQILDDYADLDDSIRQAFGVPVDGIAWDAVSFMVFRTLFTQELNVPLSPFFVKDYADMARARFGAKAGVTIGLTDPGITADAPVYRDGNDMREDVEAAYKAGIPIEKIDVYSLKGVALPKHAPADQWFQAPRDRRNEWFWPLPDLGTSQMHLISIGLDLLL